MKYVKLGKYVRIRTGKRNANEGNPNGEYPFFTCSKETFKINNYSFDCECVLVAGNGDLNVKYYDGKFDAYQRTYVLESLDKRRLNVKYLYYFLSKYIEVLRANSIGGVIKYIKLGDLTTINFPLPDVETQKKIVCLLDKTQKLIKYRKQQIEKLDELVQSIYINLFGYPLKNEKKWKRLKVIEFAKIVNGTTPSTNEPKYWGDKYFWLTPADIVEGEHYKWSTKRMLSEEGLRSKNLKIIPKNNVLLTSRAPIGKVIINKVPITTNQGFKSFILNKQIVHEEYLYYTLLLLKDYLNSLGRGATFKEISKTIVENIEINVPPIKLQHKFASIVEQIEKQKEHLKQSLKLMEDNFNSLMQRAFRGELG